MSVDGTLRVWNIDVRYNLSEDPKTLLTVCALEFELLFESLVPRTLNLAPVT